MYDEFDGRPRLPLIIIVLIFAAFLAFLGWRIQPGESVGLGSIKFILLVLACGMALWGGLGLIEWIVKTWIDIVEMANKARYPVILADHIQGLHPAGVDLLRQSSVWEVIGTFTQDFELDFRVRGKPVDFDWDFMIDYLKASKANYPNFAPIGKAYQICPDHRNAERQAEAVTNAFIEFDWAERDAGNKTAYFLVPWEQVARKFNLEDK